MAQCPKCDGWTSIPLSAQDVLCRKCGVWFTPKRQWLPALTVEVDGQGPFIAFGFGKHKGEPVVEHLDYASWMLKQDFPDEIELTLRSILKGVSGYGG